MTVSDLRSALDGMNDGLRVFIEGFGGNEWYPVIDAMVRRVTIYDRERDSVLMGPGLVLFFKGGKD